MAKESKIKERVELLHKHDQGYRANSNWHFLLYLAGLLIAVFAIRAFIFEPIRVDGESMQNTLQDNERCFAEKVSLWFASPKAGDIVIVHYPNRGKDTFVKRVVATAGQTVKIVKGSSKGAETAVYVDGVALDESAYKDGFRLDENWNYTTIQPVPGESYYSYDAEHDTYECTVPEGCVFVMGDHRTNSHDSRSGDVGPIPLYNVIGRVRGVIYPFDKLRRVG